MTENCKNTQFFKLEFQSIASYTTTNNILLPIFLFLIPNSLTQSSQFSSIYTFAFQNLILYKFSSFTSNDNLTQ